MIGVITVIRTLFVIPNIITTRTQLTTQQAIVYIPEGACDPHSRKNLPWNTRVVLGVNNAVT